MSDKPATASDQTNDSQANWASQVWKNIEMDQASARASQQASEGPRQAAPEMLAMEDSGTLPNCRTSC